MSLTPQRLSPWKLDTPSTPVDNSAMQAFLKSLVVTMGLMIIGGMGLLVYGFVKTSSDPDWRLFGSAEPARPAAGPSVPIAGAQPPAPPAITGDIKLGLPTGCEIKGVTELRGRIYVLTQPVGVCGEVLIVDPATGKVTGRITP